MTFDEWWKEECYFYDDPLVAAKAAWEAAAEAEREACARVCDLVPLLSGDPLRCTTLAPGAYASAAAIRARGQTND